MSNSVQNNGRFSSLSRFGFSVFPLKACDKVPSMNWKQFQASTPELDDVQAWDATNLNVGVACGPLSNIMVLDIDSEEAQSFVDELTLPETPSVRTARGKHLYFRFPKGGARNATKIEGLPLDIRGDGGYVVGPGSTHPDGTQYEWIVSPDEVAIAELPASALEKLIAGPRQEIAERSAAIADTHSEFIEAGQFSTYLNVAVDSGVEQIRQAAEGSRNDTLNRSAFILAKDVSAMDLDWGVVANALTTAALEIGLSAGETKSTLKSAWSEGSKVPTKWIRVAKDWAFVAKRDSYLHKKQREVIKPSAFSSMFNHVPIPRGLGKELGIPTNVNIAQFLTASEMVDKVLDLAFDPTKGEGVFEKGGQRYFNSYEVPSVEPVEGDAGVFTDFLEYLIPDQMERNHLLNMIAWTVRNPGGKLNHALLLRSTVHGVGKSTLIKIWRHLLGNKNTRKTNSEEIGGNFQSYIAGKLLVIVEELNLGKGHRDYNRLKDLVTEETAVINEKFVSTHEVPQFANFVFLSNITNPLLLDAEDRRFFVLDSPAQKRDGEYWKMFHTWVDDNFGVILWYLQQIDLSQFNPKEPPPMTAAKLSLIAASKTPLAQELCEMRDQMVWPFSRDVFTLSELRGTLAGEGTRVSVRELSNALREMGCLSLSQVRVAGQWMDVGIGKPSFVGGEQRQSVWACRNQNVWRLVEPKEIGAEYEREQGALVELELFPELLSMAEGYAEASGRLLTAQ